MNKKIINQFNEIQSSDIILISYAGRSGSFFLGGLLDGSSNVLNFNPYLDRKIFYILWKYYENQNKKNFYNLLKNLKIKINEHFSLIKNKSLDQIKISHKLNIMIKKMLNIFKKLIIYNKKNLSLDLLLKIFYFSFYKIFLKNKKLCKNTKILINIHGMFPPNDFIYILKRLKKFYWITMIRNPLKSIDSHYKHTLEQEKNTIQFLFGRVLTQYKLALFFLYENGLGYFKKPLFNKFIQDFKKLNVSKNFYLVSFERLHLYPRKSMKSICKRLGINYSSKNLCDTISGHQVFFEGQQGKISGFSEKQAQNQEINFMSFFEKKTVEIIFRDEIKLLKYNSSYKKRFCNLFYLISLFKLRVNYQKGNLTKLVIKFIFLDIFKEFKLLLSNCSFLFFKNIVNNKKIKFIN